jgi:hypothetical protein
MAYKNEHIKSLNRATVISLLEEIGVACYERESTSLLKACLDDDCPTNIHPALIEFALEEQNGGEKRPQNPIVSY